MCGCVLVFLLVTEGITQADQTTNTESKKRFRPGGSCGLWDKQVCPTLLSLSTAFFFLTREFQGISSPPHLHIPFKGKVVPFYR